MRTTIALMLICGGAVYGAQPVLEFNGESVIVQNVDPEPLHAFARYYNDTRDWKEVFPVFTAESGESMTVDGSYEVTKNSVSFTPRYPFSPGVVYNATFHYGQLLENHNEIYRSSTHGEDITLTFKLPDVDGVMPSVSSVYPTTAMVPENLLRFHIVFNTPMSGGDVYNMITIVDEQGRKDANAFLKIDQELWDSEMRTLTVMLDPGRIKRGLKANLQMGAPLQAGRAYRLMIDRRWKSAEGNLMQESFLKEFQVTAADRTSPDPGRWRMRLPGTPADALMIESGEPLDFVLLQEGIRVTSSSGKPVPGKIVVLAEESGVEFHPDDPWLPGEYLLMVNPLLEDLAGNNAQRLFEADIQSSQAVRRDCCSKKFLLDFRQD